MFIQQPEHMIRRKGRVWQYVCPQCSWEGDWYYRRRTAKKQFQDHQKRSH